MRKLEFDYVPLGKIDVSDSDAQRTNREEDIDALASSIDEIGLQQPVVVIRKEDR